MPAARTAARRPAASNAGPAKREQASPVNRLPKRPLSREEMTPIQKRRDTLARKQRERVAARVAAVKAAKCDFIDNPEFADRAVQKEILALPLIEQGTKARLPRRPAGLPNYSGRAV